MLLPVCTSDLTPYETPFPVLFSAEVATIKFREKLKMSNTMSNK